MAQFILRVDDCGWLPDKTDDVGLEYFQRWRNTFGIAGLPVYYGFIPQTIGLRELDWLRSNLEGGERVALHGYDHAPGAIVTLDQMRRARNYLRGCGQTVRYYIPPFNAYDTRTTSDWGDAGCVIDNRQDNSPFPFYGISRYAVLFGGFPDDEQSLRLGTMPCVHGRDRLIHLPAYRPLYDRAGPVTNVIDQHLHFDHPVVVTLHITWDANTLGNLPGLLEKLKPHLVGVQAAEDWLRQKGVAVP